MSQADLRVYGKVQTEFAPNRIVFQCQDAGHADILMGKLLADLFWDAGDKVKTAEIRVAKQPLIVREYPPYGAVLIARIENKVLALGGEDVAGVSAAATNEPLLRTGVAVSSPQAAYPQTLDFYDLKAVKFYLHPMNSPRGCGLDSHWPFVQKLGLGGVAFQDLGFNTASPAPGVVQWAMSDYEVRQAELQKGMIVPSIQVGGGMPFWMHNQFPTAMAQFDPSVLNIGWGGMPALTNLLCQSFGTPSDLERDTCLNFQKQAMQRYGNSPAVGGWQIYSGMPGAELGCHLRSTENLDYSPLGQESFRNYLSQVKGYSLADMGRRWFGDPTHFSSWQQVFIPDVHGFYGNLNEDCFQINGGWSWLPKEKADKAGDADKGGVPDASADWFRVEMPPSQQQVTLPWHLAYYKAAFDPGQWPSQHSGQKVWLVCDVAPMRGSAHVWLNGKDLGEQKPANGRDYGPFDLDVTGLLRAGANELVLLVAGEDKVFGPIFFTATKPSFYPYLGAQRNAQFVDVTTWQRYSLYALHDTVFRDARRIDPDRAMGLASNDIWDMGDQIADLAHDYGLSVQNTGREAWYFPWWPGLGFVDDFYATGESAGTPQGSDLTRLLSWVLFDGDGSLILFWDIEDFIQREQKDGWFTQHKNALRLVGKALREKPTIALFRTVVTSRLGDSTPWNWDMGRGELQAAHFDNVYVTEREILNGKVNDYPVLVDCGSTFTDPDLIEALQRYVEAGGTFVALHNTGRHTTTEPDSWPISKLTGFRVAANTNTGGSFQFGHDPIVFRDWKDRTFPCGGPLSLHSEGSGTVSLAKWKDGSTAIGYRNLGQGRVIVIGADFWHGNREFVEHLFTDLKVPHSTNSSSPDAWTRKFITKNGLQEWLVASNFGKGALTASLSMTVEQQPDQVWDMISGDPVPFTYADGQVTIPNITIADRENRVFGVKRASLAGGLSSWWDEKTRYWKRIPDTKGAVSIASNNPIKASDPVGMETVAVEQWKFMTADDPSAPKPADTHWQLPGFNDSKWADMKPGLWNLQSEPLKDYKGTAYYRFKFSAPLSWAQHRVALGLYSWHAIAYDRAEFALNGKHITDYSPKRDTETLNFDVTDLLKQGENVLSVKVASGGAFRGISGAVWLAAEPMLDEPRDLLQGWQVVAADRKTTKPALLPGKVRGKYLVCDVDVPASWQNKNVFLHLEMPANQWLGLVMVNGHPFYYSCYGADFGTRVDINLTPWLKPGAPNRIELWPGATMPRGQGKEESQETEMNLAAARIG
ncbi:MAG: beta-galactosidase [Methylacidiphilales bacterium]|nr:beta-galactosidase [Candidatus Methylacidiphilales bacterium]